MPFNIGSLMGSSAMGWSLGYDILAMDRTRDGTSSACSNLAGVGMVARNMASDVTGAFLGMGDAARRFDTQVNVTSYSLKTSSQNIREMALSYMDVSTGADEAAGTIDALTRAGIRQEDELRAATGLFLTFADAVGESGDRITLELVPAFRAWNIPMSESGEQLDQLAYLVRNSTYDAGTLAATLERIAPDMEDMNMGFDDSVAILAVFADRGIDGRRAITDLDSAIRAATPNIDDLNSKLETTTDRLDNAMTSGEKLDIRIGGAERDVQTAASRYRRSGSAEDYNSYLDAVDRLKELQIDKRESDEEVAKLQDEKKKLEDQKTAAGNPEQQKQALYAELGKYGITPEMIEAKKTELATQAPGTAAALEEAKKKAYGPIDQATMEIQKAVLNLGAGSEIGTISQAAGFAGNLGITALALKGFGLFGGGAGTATAAAPAAAGGAAGGAGGTAAAGASGLALPVAAGVGLGLAGVYGLQEAGAMDWLGQQGAAAGQNHLLTSIVTSNPAVMGLTGLGIGINDIIAMARGEQGVDIIGDYMKFGEGYAANNKATMNDLFGGLYASLFNRSPSGTGDNLGRTNPANMIPQPVVQNNTVTFNIEKVSSDYDVDQMYARWEKNMMKDRKASGVPSV